MGETLLGGEGIFRSAACEGGWSGKINDLRTGDRVTKIKSKGRQKMGSKGRKNTKKPKQAKDKKEAKK